MLLPLVRLGPEATLAGGSHVKNNEQPVGTIEEPPAIPDCSPSPDLEPGHQTGCDELDAMLE